MEPSPSEMTNEIPWEKIRALLDLFSIASRYDFARVQQYALRSIEKLRLEPGSELNQFWSAVDRIELASRFGLDDWLFPAYKEVYKQPKFITTDEAERIGGRKTAIIAQTREMLRENRLPPGMSQPVPTGMFRAGDFRIGTDIEDMRVAHVLTEVLKEEASKSTK